MARSSENIDLDKAVAERLPAHLIFQWDLLCVIVGSSDQWTSLNNSGHTAHFHDTQHTFMEIHYANKCT